MLAALVDVAQVGYPALLVLVAVESMGVPVPGETALIAAAVLASRGKLDLPLVVALAALGAIVGDNVGYLIGRHGGRRLLAAEGPFGRARHRVLRVGEPFFARHGAKAVFFGRWTAGLRIWAAWLAGASRMGWPSFLLWNAAGGIAWATSVGVLAYLLGHAAEKALQLAGVVGAVGVVVAALGAYLVWHRRRTHASPPDGGLASERGTSVERGAPVEKGASVERS